MDKRSFMAPEVLILYFWAQNVKPYIFSLVINLFPHNKDETAMKLFART